MTGKHVHLFKPDTMHLPEEPFFLGQVGAKAKFALASLTNCLEDDDAGVRLQAAQSVWKISRAAKRILPILISGLESHDKLLRIEAAETLEQIGPEAAAAVPALRKAINDPNPEVHRRVAAALRSIESPKRNSSK